MSTPNFFSELKRRNVYKVAVAYAVVAWLLIQAASILLPTFDAPASAMKILVALLAIGFPIALGFSWAFEITPEGIKRESEVAPNRSIAYHTGRRLVGLTIGLAVIAGALFAFQMLRAKTTRVVEGGVPARPSTSNAPAIPDKSIAVLPFDNLSDEKANAYFAEGIQDEVLTRLAKIGALKVISRSSTKQYQSKPGNLREIAQQLGVANILEGSVQKAGSAVHVNVQLIKAVTDDHLWAESYDRTLENIFGVEGEIAQNIAEALKAKLSGTEEKLLTQKPTNNPAAYDAYLRGMSQYHAVDDTIQKLAPDSFADAVRLDPQFALAWAALSRSQSRMFFGQEMTPERRASAEKALAEATRLQPDLPETQLARASFQYWVLRDYGGALEMMGQLRNSWPNNADVLQTMSFISARLGKWPKALADAEQAVALNPRDLYTRICTLNIATGMREFDKVLGISRSALQIWPNDSNLMGIRACALQACGQFDQAQLVLDALPQDSKELDGGTVALLNQARAKHDFAKVRKVMDAYRASATQAALSDPSFLLYSGIVQELTGEKDKARENYTRARDLLSALLKAQPTNAALIGPWAFALAWLNQRDDVIAALARYEAASAGDARAIGTGYDLRARIFARLGDKAQAISNIEKGLTVPIDGIYGLPLTAAMLRVDPDFDSLHGDPRFEKLLGAKP